MSDISEQDERDEPTAERPASEHDQNPATESPAQPSAESVNGTPTGATLFQRRVEELERMLHQHLGNDSLDEGNADIFDELVDAWLDEELVRIDEEIAAQQYREALAHEHAVHERRISSRNKVSDERAARRAAALAEQHAVREARERESRRDLAMKQAEMRHRLEQERLQQRADHDLHQARLDEVRRREQAVLEQAEREVQETDAAAHRQARVANREQSRQREARRHDHRLLELRRLKHIADYELELARRLLLGDPASLSSLPPLPSYDAELLPGPAWDDPDLFEETGAVSDSTAVEKPPLATTDAEVMFSPQRDYAADLEDDDSPEPEPEAA